MRNLLDSRTRLGLALLAVAALGACRSAAHETSPRPAPAAAPAPIVQPGAPGEPSRVVDAQQAAEMPGVQHAAADVRFMQGMIAHHAQAIVMSRMAEANGANPRLLKLANKIDQSQMPEILQMQGWLRYYKQEVPDTSSWRTMTMDGMLNEQQMKELEAAKGVEFDRVFLNYMIMHHEGALKMVKDLFAAPRAGQEVDVGIFANDVVTAQTAEIGVMRQMLAALPPKK